MKKLILGILCMLTYQVDANATDFKSLCEKYIPSFLLTPSQRASKAFTKLHTTLLKTTKDGIDFHEPGIYARNRRTGEILRYFESETYRGGILVPVTGSQNLADEYELLGYSGVYKFTEGPMENDGPDYWTTVSYSRVRP
jgi:hypothetical protein